MQQAVSIMHEVLLLVVDLNSSTSVMHHTIGCSTRATALYYYVCGDLKFSCGGIANLRINATNLCVCMCVCVCVCVCVCTMRAV